MLAASFIQKVSVLVLVTNTLLQLAFCHLMYHGDENIWNEDLQAIHEAEGDKCEAHTRSHLLMEMDENYKQNHIEENERADQFVNEMRLKKYAAKKQAEKLKISQGRSLLYSDYDDQVDKQPIIRIPIVFNVLFTEERHNLSAAQLESQIKVVNDDFRANNSGIRNGEVSSIWNNRTADAKLQFYWNATQRRQIENASSFCTVESDLKNFSAGGLDGYDPKYHLNVWICPLDGLLGYAVFPCLLDTLYEYRDGVVLTTGAVGSVLDDDGSFYIENGSNYQLGITLTHEIGHWLNLYHIWGDYLSCNQSIATDYCSDTPPSYGPNYGCPNGTNSCDSIDPELGIDLPDMYENFMDYSFDECLFIFTDEQAWRMWSVLSPNGCRRELYYQGAEVVGNETLQPSSSNTGRPSDYVTCDDGCPIFEDYVNDGWCDCTNCEDEESWNCTNCYGGCPQSCGGWGYCPSPSPAPATTVMTNATDTTDTTDTTDATETTETTDANDTETNNIDTTKEDGGDDDDDDDESSSTTSEGGSGQGNNSGDNSDDDDEVEWWVWLIVVALIVFIILWIATIVYYRNKIKTIQSAKSSDQDYQLMQTN